MGSLEPPEDESVRTLYVGGVVDGRVTEQDLRDCFSVHGEIESIKVVEQRGCAFVTYATRDAAEKAAEELCNKLVVKGLRLKLAWGRPQAPRVQDEEARQPDVAVAPHRGLLPQVGAPQQDQSAPQQYQYMAPPSLQGVTTFYSSRDPQRMGSLVGRT